MFQSPYLSVTKSGKYCGALETRPLLVTTVVGFVVGGGSWLRDTVTGSTHRLIQSGESHLSDLLWKRHVLSQVQEECHQ